MKLIKATNKGERNWLQGVDPKHWARSHFIDFLKFDILLNNYCEVFNKFILEDRDKPILTMLEMIRCKMMVRLARRAKAHSSWITKWCPKIEQNRSRTKKLLGDVNYMSFAQQSINWKRMIMFLVLTSRT